MEEKSNSSQVSQIDFSKLFVFDEINGKLQIPPDDICACIRSFKIARNVQNIEQLLGGKFSSLTKILVEPGNPKFDSRNNCNAIIEKN